VARVDNVAMHRRSWLEGRRHAATRDSDAALSRRVQMLATEHWGLLAARSTAQNEVLARITIYLALVSAVLITIGLLGQASDFRRWFPAAALSLLAFLLLIGLLTQVRVFNVSEEDMMFVVAMNRLRSGYVDIDPTLEDLFLEATTDDIRGMEITYSFLRRRGNGSQATGGSAFLISLVNACVLGVLVGGLAATLGAALLWAVLVGAVLSLAFAAATVTAGYRGFREVWSRYIPRRPTRTERHPWLDRQ
jgi:hypothetical protein